ncbi:nitrogenase component 1 [Desulforhopalus singaporensis]|uniref:Nitrogenase molybdenum-iron protein NifN n=1 Tax=Desulforhopalus singaporensis TaxID=91360 RepID=A0A1H0Q5Z4_9BACT|nr:nitrogenase component 1 [Desulforhopalus singaporensis]SDP12744.1 nitrogenase molybdenum-iron protein NifN [Desulforhopalus singaporensis]
MTKMTNYTATTNACKLCSPLGASIAFRGIEGCVPFLHGSQGCATYMRRYIISHYNEPIDIASSSLGEKNAIYGGGPNLKLGLKNVTAKYCPQLIGVATTCLTETIGDNVPMLLAEYNREFSTEDSPELVHVSTPSYSGTHMEGFTAAVAAVVEQLAAGSETTNSLNMFSGFVSPADIRYLKEVCRKFKQQATIIPDYSDTLDGPALDDYPLIPEGGTPVESIKKMGGAVASLELGWSLPEKTGGRFLADRFNVALHRTGLPMGIRATDAFLDLLEKLSNNPIPPEYRAERGRLVDSMVDGHKYLFGKRAVIYGEEELVIGMTSFLVETGIHPVLCASGGKSGKFKAGIEEITKGFDCPPPIVRDGVDFYDIEALAKDIGVDIVIGNSKGYALARRENLPLIRVGFPIHDRIGGQRILHLGYRGAQALFDLIANTIIDRKQSDSPVGYSYM